MHVFDRKKTEFHFFSCPQFQAHWEHHQLHTTPIIAWCDKGNTDCCVFVSSWICSFLFFLFCQSLKFKHQCFPIGEVQFKVLENNFLNVFIFPTSWIFWSVLCHSRCLRISRQSEKPLHFLQWLFPLFHPSLWFRSFCTAVAPDHSRGRGGLVRFRHPRQHRPAAKTWLRKRTDAEIHTSGSQIFLCSHLCGTAERKCKWPVRMGCCNERKKRVWSVMWVWISGEFIEHKAGNLKKKGQKCFGGKSNFVWKRKW